MSPTLHIDCFCLGPWMTNCYVAYTDTGRCWIVDAGFEPQSMIESIRSRGLEPEKIVLTHAHVDHIAGLHELRHHWPDLPILIHEAERDFLTKPAKNLSLVLDQSVVAPRATGAIQHGQVLELDGVGFEVRHTPGHSPGGVALVQPQAGVAIVGDTLFAGSIGRHDFPTSDYEALVQSIRTQLYTLPDTTRVLPGHGQETTIGAEKASNPFVRG